MAHDEGWKVEHAEGRRYVITSLLDYEASDVLMTVLSKTTNKPGAPEGTNEEVWRGEFDGIQPGESIEAGLRPKMA